MITKNLVLILSIDVSAVLRESRSTQIAGRIPHDWRKRQIRLPTYDLLRENDVPPDVAEEFAGKAVSVNYRPGIALLPARWTSFPRWPRRKVAHSGN